MRTCTRVLLLLATLYTTVPTIHPYIMISTKLTCYSEPTGDKSKDCDKTRGFRTCFTRYDHSDRVTGRGCSTKKSSYKECETHSYGELTEKFCYCKKHLCNAANSLFSPSALLSLTLAVALCLLNMRTLHVTNSPLIPAKKTKSCPTNKHKSCSQSSCCSVISPSESCCHGSSSWPSERSGSCSGSSDSSCDSSRGTSDSLVSGCGLKDSCYNSNGRDSDSCSFSWCSDGSDSCGNCSLTYSPRMVSYTPSGNSFNSTLSPHSTHHTLHTTSHPHPHQPLNTATHPPTTHPPTRITRSALHNIKSAMLFEARLVNSQRANLLVADSSLEDNLSVSDSLRENANSSSSLTLPPTTSPTRKTATHSL